MTKEVKEEVKKPLKKKAAKKVAPKGPKVFIGRNPHTGEDVFSN